MFKKMIAALLLTVMCISACAYAEAIVPAYLVPESFAAAAWDVLDQYTSSYDELSPEDVEQIMTALELEMSDIEENVLYFDNEDWSVEASFFYGDDEIPDAAKPAQLMNYTISTAMDPTCAAFAEIIIPELLYALDDTIDLDALVDWLMNCIGSEDLDSMNFDLGSGYLLLRIPGEDAVIYAILPDENIG